MNYMEQVAQMLGVELEEEFKISIAGEYRFKLMEDGLVFFDTEIKSWEYAYDLTDLLSGRVEIIKLPKQILTDKEKEYLSNVIKPFRDTVKRIVKGYDFGKEFICIELERGEIQLPYFEPDTMYKGMEIYKQYTLEDLGL